VKIRLARAARSGTSCDGGALHVASAANSGCVQVGRRPLGLDQRILRQTGLGSNITDLPTSFGLATA